MLLRVRKEAPKEKAVESAEGDKKYFLGLRARLGDLPGAVKEEVMRHVDYLADKAGTSRDAILGGRSFAVLSQILADAKKILMP